MKRSRELYNSDQETINSPIEGQKKHDSENSAASPPRNENITSSVHVRHQSGKESKHPKRCDDTRIEPSDLPQGVIDLAESVERNAAQANLTMKNVKSILHHLFSDKKLLDFAKKAALDASEYNGESPYNCAMEPIMTRSKWKEKNCKSMTDNTFVKADLAEDSEDEEYRPENESAIAASDDDDETISTTFSDLQSPLSTGTPEKAAVQIDDSEKHQEQNDPYSRQQDFAIHEDGTVFRMPTTPVLTHRIKNHVEDEKEIIANRTRSKFSMRDLSLETLEASFDPPDYDPALYDNEMMEEMDQDDLEWKNWLNKLIHTDEIDESMDENDEDFNFMAIEETMDKEEFRTDKGANIPHKELQDLFDEVLNDFDECIEDETTILRCLIPQLPVMTLEQRIILTSQLQQHTQLLCQTYLLTWKDPLLCKESQNCKDYIKELGCFRDAMRKNPSLRCHSMYSFEGLDDALRIIDSPDLEFELEHILSQLDVMNSVRHKDRKGRRNSLYINIPTRVCLRFFLEPYFATYYELLPKQGLLATERLEELYGEAVRLKFFRSEDSLLALGLSQFGSEYGLISQYLLPTKTPRQLRTRAKNLTSKREYENPVKMLKRDEALPGLTAKVNISLPRSLSSMSVKQLYNRINHHIPVWIDKLYGQVKLIEDERNKQANLTASYIAFAARNKLRPIIAKPPSVVQLPVKVIGTMIPNISRVTKVDQSVQTCTSPSDASCPFQMPEDNENAIEIRVRDDSSTIKTDDCNEDIQGITAESIAFCKEEAITASIVKSNVDEPAAGSCNNDANEFNHDRGKLDDNRIGNEFDKSIDVHCRDHNDSDAEKQSPCNLPISDESGNYSAEEEVEEKEAKEIITDHVDCVAEMNFDSAVEEEIIEKNSARLEQSCVKGTVNVDNGEQQTKSKEGSKAKRNSAILHRNNQTNNHEFNWNEKLQEKASKFADLYFQKVKETLADNCELYSEFLRLITENGTAGASKVELYRKLANLLKDHLNLVEMFVGFLEPCQAKEVGQFKTWLEFEKAKYFLLRCEATFVKPKYYHQLLRKMIKLQEIGMEPKKFVETITPLFRGNHHLIAEFSSFFEDLSPSQSRTEDYEVIKYKQESNGFDYVDEFEEVKLKTNDFVDSEDVLQRKKGIADDFAAWLQKAPLNINEMKNDQRRLESCTNILKSDANDNKENNISMFTRSENQRQSHDAKNEHLNVLVPDIVTDKQSSTNMGHEVNVEGFISEICIEHTTKNEGFQTKKYRAKKDVVNKEMDISCLASNAKVHQNICFGDKLTNKVEKQDDHDNNKDHVKHIFNEVEEDSKRQQTSYLARGIQIFTHSDLVSSVVSCEQPCQSHESLAHNSVKESNLHENRNTQPYELKGSRNEHSVSKNRQMQYDQNVHNEIPTETDLFGNEGSRLEKQEKSKTLVQNEFHQLTISVCNENSETKSSPSSIANAVTNQRKHCPTPSSSSSTSSFDDRASINKLSESPSGTYLKKFRLDLKNTGIIPGFQKIVANDDSANKGHFARLQDCCEKTPSPNMNFDEAQTRYCEEMTHKTQYQHTDNRNIMDKNIQETESKMKNKLFDNQAADEISNTFLAGDVHYNEHGEILFKWSKDDDRLILTMCQKRGPSESTFSMIAEQLSGRSSIEIEQRFRTLMELYKAAAK